MKYFLDTANLQDIENTLKKGFLTGVTTNPSILSKEPKTDLIEHFKKIAKICKDQKQILPLSVEVMTKDTSKMLEQALDLVEKINYEKTVIKIPVGWDELDVIYQLSKRGIPVNCTCIFTEAQALMAANAGAAYVSIFYGRLRDIGTDPIAVIANTRKMLDHGKSPSEIIVGSIRHHHDITSAHIAGGHIVTAPPKLLSELTTHPQTTKSVDGFIKDFEQWLK